MKVTTHDHPFPYLEFEDFLTGGELESVCNELEMLRLARALKRPEATGTAVTVDGEVLKSNLGIFIDQQYVGRREHSATLTAVEKLFSDDSLREAVYASNSWYFGDTFYATNRHGTLLTYYEDSDYYRPHRDAAIYTFVMWLYREPKGFDGGDLLFPDYGIRATMGSNRAVLFPSMVKHEVTAVKMDETLLGRGMGRYAISVFIDNLKNVPIQG